MYYLPQEIETMYIIPALRREMAICLIKNFNASYDKTGKILGVTKSAVSQYQNKKRAAKIKLPSVLNRKIKSSCKLLIKEQSTAEIEITKLLDYVRKKGLAFEVCSKLNEGVLEDCREIRFKKDSYY